MRRLLLVTALLAAGLAPAPAQAAAVPTVTGFSLSRTAGVDTTAGDVGISADVGVTDAPGGAGITGLYLEGGIDPRPAEPEWRVIQGFGDNLAPRSTVTERIPLTVPGGYMRTWRFSLFAYLGDGSGVDLTPQIALARRTVTSVVTAAPRAPSGLKVTKDWSSTFHLNVNAHWQTPAGPVAAGNRTSGTRACGRNDWPWWFYLNDNRSADAPLFGRCTVTVRLFNDFGESAPVSASA